MGLLGVASPRDSSPLLSSVVFGLPELCVPRGVQQTSTDVELLSSDGQQSTPRQSCEDWAVIDWVRLLGDCLGRTGRYRRAGGNRSIPTRFLPAWRVVYQLYASPSLTVALGAVIAPVLSDPASPDGVWRAVTRSVTTPQAVGLRAGPAVNCLGVKPRGTRPIQPIDLHGSVQDICLSGCLGFSRSSSIGFLRVRTVRRE